MKRREAENVWRWGIDTLRDENKSQDMLDGILANTLVRDCHTDGIVIVVDNEFIRDWIVSNVQERIVTRFRELTQQENFIINYVVEKIPRTDIEVDDKERRRKQQRKLHLNAKYDFKSFVVGKTNEFAHAASKGVAKSPGLLYNPLFIYGGVGLGKTHLLQAIGNQILEKDENAVIIYKTSEVFLNEMIDALSTGRIKQFKKKYRNADLLLIDDIQFISGKETTQEEFFHTFNELHNTGRQIVLSSDRPPHELQKVEKRLISRFESGMVADIQSPDYELRMAILKNKSREFDVKISDELLSYLVSRVTSNIRQLEGRFITLVGKASILKKSITKELIDDILKDHPADTARFSMDDLIKTVATFFEVDISQMTGKRRNRQIVRPRQVCMWLARELMGSTLEEIGNCFGGRDHTTVLYAFNKIEAEMESDPTLKQQVEEIRKRITTK